MELISLIARIVQLYIIGVVLKAIVKHYRRDQSFDKMEERPQESPLRPAGDWDVGREIRRIEDLLLSPKRARRSNVESRNSEDVSVGMGRPASNIANKEKATAPLNTERDGRGNREERSAILGIPIGDNDDTLTSEGKSLEWEDIDDNGWNIMKKTNRGKGYKESLKGRGIIELEGDAFMKGIIMAELLGPPRCKRRKDTFFQ